MEDNFKPAIMDAIFNFPDFAAPFVERTLADHYLSRWLEIENERRAEYARSQNRRPPPPQKDGEPWDFTPLLVAIVCEENWHLFRDTFASNQKSSGLSAEDQYANIWYLIRIRNVVIHEKDTQEKDNFFNFLIGILRGIATAECLDGISKIEELAYPGGHRLVRNPILFGPLEFWPVYLEGEMLVAIDARGDPAEGNFINRAMYARVLAREGYLREAYDMLEALYSVDQTWREADAQRYTFNVAAHRHEIGVALCAHGLYPSDGLDELLNQAINRIKGVQPPFFYFNEAMHGAVLGNAQAARNKAIILLDKMSHAAAKNFEQEAAHLAIAGAATEVLGDFAAANGYYRQIKGLRPELGNRPGMMWLAKRPGEITEHAPATILRDVVQCLYPIQT